MPGFLRLSILTLRTLVYGMLAIVICRALLFTSYKVAGTSMRLTLEDGDQILVCQTLLFARAPAVGDTVIVDVDGEILVKRVMAAPGDRIAMQDGVVLRNGQPVQENIPSALNCGDSFPVYPLRTDEYFVLGDHRRVSVDSREFGPVRGAQLRGQVLFRVSGIAVSTVAALERTGS